SYWTLTMDEQSSPASGLEALWELERFLKDAAQARVGLGEVERESERRGRELVRLALQAHIDSRGDGDVGEAIFVSAPDGPVRLGYKRIRSRRILAVCGPLQVTRVGYGAPGEPTVYPLDAELRLPARTYSYEYQRRLMKAVVCSPFDEGIAFVAEMTGTTVPKRAVEQLVREAAVDFDDFYSRRTQGEVKPAKGELLVGAIDCKGIPMVKPERALRVVRRGKGEKANKKRMATVAAVHSQPPVARNVEEVLDNLFRTEERPERPKRTPPNHKRVWASLTADKDTFIQDVKAEMTRRDPRHQHTWVIVTDGERALQRRVTDSFTDVTLVLDLLHVLEKLWACANALHREGSPEGQAFVYQRANRILNGQVSQVIKGLRQIVTKRKLTGNKAKTLLDVAAYYQRNRERMRYDTYLANGWPIASGSVEGACKNLIRDRFERSGMRWTPETAEALLRLRATYLSGDLDAYWEFHIQQDQERLHPRWQVDSK
ncbi:MAG: ISKra4 family transposase, partial [Solirubrobacteraceae bacterium]